LIRATANNIASAIGSRIIDGNSGVVGAFVAGGDVAVGFMVAASEGR
jgi:uncharacterized membrane protein YjfL (UPF0719 family)